MKFSIRDNYLFIETRQDISKYFSYKVKTKYRNRFTGRTEEYNKTEKIFTKPNKYKYKIPIGYVFYALNLFHDKLDQSNVQEIVKMFRSDLKINDYYTLYDYQIEDLNQLIKFKRGVMSVYTGYGKSELISVLVKNAIDQGLRVLVISPNKGVGIEIHDRLKKYGIRTHSYVNNDAQINIINPVGLCNSNEWERLRKSDFKWFRSVDMMISDETEMTTHQSFQRVFKRLDKCQYFYGFSATINKSGVKPIPRDESLRSILNNQIDKIVSVYGFSAVYRLPKHLKVRINSLIIDLNNFKSRASDYHEVVRELFTEKLFVYAIRYILGNSENLYIPVNNLDVINSLIKLNLSDKILTCTGDGYKIYLNSKYLKHVSLNEAKRLIAEKSVKLILGSSASFRGLDLKGATNVLATFGKSTSITIQYAGRTARGDEMTIWFIKSEKLIPIYSNTIERNEQLLTKYYSLCEIEYKEIYL